MIKIIKSNRSYEEWPSWHIVHEWEDVIADKLGIPIYKGDFLLNLIKLIPIKKYRYKLCVIYNYTRNFKMPALVFHISPQKSLHQVASHDVPVIIDFWRKDLENIKNAYINCNIIYVTSKEVLEFLNKSTKLNIRYIPMTLPDQYFLGSQHEAKNAEIIRRKDIDILQLGRSNEVLEKWTKSYIETNPDCHYVYQKVDNGEIFICSNKFGVIAGGNERSLYFDMLKRAKVSLYSSPGIDSGYSRTGGFNPLTPRLLEALSQFNYVIARYVENVEYDEIKDHILNCESYSDFEHKMNSYLKEGDKSFFEWSHAFLSQYLTSRLKNDLAEIG